MTTINERFSALKRYGRTGAAAVAAFTLAGCLTLGLGGCSQGASTSSASATASATTQTSTDDATSTTALAVTTVDETPYDLEYTDREKDPSYDESSATKVSLSGSSATCDSSDVTVNGSTVTISAAGVYVLSGTLDGQVVVDAPEDAKVQIVLNGVTITNSSGAAVYVKQADKCFVTSADGSTNVLSDGATYALADGEDEPDATLFSTCDLVLQGSGSLTVDANYNDAVKSKDDLVVTGGTYEIAAVSDGLVGKDSVKIADGSISITTENGDGIKSSKDDTEGKGFVSIDGGDISIDAADKGVKAATYLRVTGGTVDVLSSDDALHSSGSMRILDGTVSVNAGDDAFHTEYELSVEGGNVSVATCYEGYEGQIINVSGGYSHIIATDDGVNAASPDGDTDTGETTSEPGGQAGGADTQPGFSGQAPEAPQDASGTAPSGDQPSAAGGDARSGRQGAQMPGGQGGMGGGMMMDADESCELNITGGTLVVEAEGDGLDSNGYITLSGGEVYVSGPTNSGNGAIDYGVGATANGGTLIAVGSVGMAESFTDGTQPFALVSISGSAGQELTVTDSSGNVVASYTPTKSYQCAVITAPGMVEGATYTATTGGTSVEFTASTTATSSGMGMGAQMGGGQQGGPNGQMGGGQGGAPMGGVQGGGQMGGGPGSTTTSTSA